MSSEEPHASISFPDGSHVRSSSTGTSSVNTIDATLSRPNYIKKPSLHIMSTSTTSTTTDLVTNPILSNISVPKISPPTSSSIATATSTSHVTGTASHSNIKANANTSTSVNKKNLPPTTSGRIPSSTIKRYPSRYKPSHSLQLPIKNDSNFKRSSIYASKSTVTAIPIRNNRPISMQNSYARTPDSDHDDVGDEVSSIKSASSSLTASLSKSFLFAFYNNRKKDKTSNNGVLSKEYWMKDESSKECFSCGKTFNTFRRKHHCRICGQIFCSSCTLLIDGDRFGCHAKMRVCYNCYEHADTYEDSSDEENDSTMQLNEPRSRSRSRSSNTNPYSHSHSHLHLISQDNHNGTDLHDPVAATDNPQQQNEVYLLNDDDVQSIMTSGEDSKLFISTPPPPPKMAIPATKQGGSLEISFDSENDRALHYQDDNPGRHHHLDSVPTRYTIRDMDNISHYDTNSNSTLRPHYNTNNSTITINNLNNTTSNNSNYNNTNSNSNINNPAHSLRRSIFHYVSSNSVNKDSNNSSATPASSAQSSSILDPANRIIGNYAHRNYKFKFNYNSKGPSQQNDTANGNNDNNNNNNNNNSASGIADNNNIPSNDNGTTFTLDKKKRNPLTKSKSTSAYLEYPLNEEDSSEDEGSMSIYSVLNDDHKTDNPIRSMRNSTKSFQRAQASLQRMRFRRKSKSKHFPNNSKSSIYRDLNFLTNSTPNLLSVVSDDNLYDDSSPLQDKASSSAASRLTDRKFSNSSGSNNNSNSNSNINTDPWKRIASISGFKLKKEKKRELNEVSLLHMHALLKQLLNDQEISNLQEWITLLDGALRKVLRTILNARDLNTLDFRQTYVKIKRISGGSPQNSEYIDGVVFSKALPSKTMPRHLKNPRILLIMFPLEYQKNNNHFLSIESVFRQEREYLDKLVSRLKSLHPDIIYVGANVSGYALELLNDSGIVVQFNMKPQVIERIAKLTEADIAISVDKLATNIKMGECETFEVKSYIYGNISKTYTFLRGCNPELGGTILLRGDSLENLRKIKQVSEFMVYAIFSLKLESSFFNDNFIQLSTDVYLKRAESKKLQVFEGYFADFLIKFNNRILTVSPTVDFPIPFLLEKARGLEKKLIERINQYESESDLDRQTQLNMLQGLESTITKKHLGNLIKFLHEMEIENLELEFQKRSRQWEVSYSSSQNLLGTGSHQSITVLYSMVSTKTATPCVGPQIVTIDYFWDSDISIGQFIENVVGTARYPCQQGCNGLYLDHYRSYVHGSGKVDVLIEKFQTRLPKLKDIILTWSYCKKCGTSTPILQISEKTWNYSFGKYLEVMFWSYKDSVTGIGKCPHDFTKDHVKYFGYNDLVVRLEYSDLEVHELITPPRKIKWKPHIDIKLKVELYYKILEKINNFYGSVLSRLERIKLDSMTKDKVLSGQAKIIELKSNATEEQKLMLQDLDTFYADSPCDQHLPLNLVIKSLYDKAVNWNSTFAIFAKSYLPSETDISRITAKQLKKLFYDSSRKDSEDKKSLHDEKAKTRKPEKNELPLEELKDVEKPKIDSKNTTENRDITNEPQNAVTITTLKDDTPIIPTSGTSHLTVTPSASSVSSSLTPQTEERPPISRSGTGISMTHDKSTRPNIRKMSSDSSLCGLASLANEYSKNNKVSKLATFFDQMHFDALSKEFELERERERLQLNKDKYQAIRLQTSTPIVEIYKNVKDAVDEPLHSRSSGNNLSSANVKTLEAPVGEHSRANNCNPPNLDQNLETELENSISQWGENILNPSGKTTASTHLTSKPVVKETSENPKSIVRESDNSKSEPLPPVITTTTVNKVESTPQPEKSLLMKTLSNFWADRSAYLWKPLVYPTCPSEHIFTDSDVIIREDEPSSLIAFCLSTSDYRNKMMNLNAQQQPQQQTAEAAPAKTGGNSGGTTQTGDPSVNISPSVSTTSHNKGRDSEISSLVTTKEGLLNTPPIEGTRDRTPQESQTHSQANLDTLQELEKIMTKKTATHLRYQFEEGLTVMSCKIFFTEHFDVFRKICDCQENFIQSLSRCVKWDSNGGKSGSGFLKTLDDRFIIKELSHAELEAFIKFAPSYFEYMAQAMFHDLPTTLAKVFGFYQIQVKSSISSSKSYKMDVIIMENLFYEKKTTRIFDLKGSMRNRHVEQTGKANEVLLDENMVEYIYESPIHVREYDKKLLRASVWNDTLFLAKMNVMDYSLVIGIDNEGYTLTVGIIDFIRTFTWDKKLESWVKEKGLVGGASVIKQPTVVTPRQYKKRFREAMERYILMVPDPWYREGN
ncbi:Fab1p [Saccharomyces cerevisiae YJM1250]|nr:Fab1p [Saccharomyces cerevisiae YJM1250]